MLKHTGFGQTSDAFGGGIGEEQFSSFLRQAHAAEISERGGVGLAECIFESLKESVDER
ncbi:rod-binding protein [Tropicimonas marinistellae]|uniref:rod-binding protein n=1 Tax=Tropicimonas marinistellae TaxID=1739787 RepID=UPI001F378431|nr:rod-binding protein [Tropicimonas marinistellae]